MRSNLISPGGDTDIADWRTAIRGARCVSSYTRRSKRMKKGPIVPPGWNNNLIVDAILFLPTGAVVDIWSHWLPSCLVPSSVPDGRHDLNLMVAPLYSCTPRRSLRVALAIKILFLPPWPLALPPRLRTRFFLDLFVLDPSFLSLSFSPSLSFFPRVSSSSLGARRDTRRQLKVPVCPGRLHDP